MIFNFQLIPVTFFSVACIALGRKERSIFTRHGSVSPGDRRSHARGQNLFSVPTTKPQILPQDPPLVDVCAL